MGSGISIDRHLCVVISGCDTGFGHGLTARLAARGFTVLAGCYTAAGKREWKGTQGVEPFDLDITNSESVAAAAALVGDWLRADPSRRIHALVNNAGIAMGGLVDWTSMDEYRRTMEVNFFGHVAMTKALLPLFLVPHDANAPRRRIVNTTSIAGIIAAPSMSAYASAKYALEAFSDSLRRELRKWSVSVSIIEPSFLGTPLLGPIETAAKAQWAGLTDATRARWGSAFFENYLKNIRKTAQSAESPSLGVDALEAAVCDANPAIRYRAGTAGKTVLPILAILPAFIADFLVSLISRGPPPAGLSAHHTLLDEGMAAAAGVNGDAAQKEPLTKRSQRKTK